MATQPRKNMPDETCFESHHGTDGPLAGAGGKKQQAFFIHGKTNTVEKVKVAFITDSQQPEIRIFHTNKCNGTEGYIACLLKNCRLQNAIEGQNNQPAFKEFVRSSRQQFPELHEINNALVYHVAETDKEPVIAWLPTRWTEQK